MDFNKTLDTVINYVVEFATSFGFKLVEAIVVLLVGLWLIKIIKKFIKTSPRLDKLDPSLRSFLTSFISLALGIVLVITIVSILGVPATSLLTVLASCGVAIGLALQGSLANFAGGIMILLFKPFKVGDFIEASGESGTVKEITVVYTILVTPDNKCITIPNGTLTNSVIENYSTEDTRRVDLTFNVAYNSDSAKVKEILERLATAHPCALKEPAPFVRLTKQGDSALEYSVRVWCKSSDYWTVNLDLTEQVKEEFDKNGIQIPFPQMDVHINK